MHLNVTAVPRSPSLRTDSLTWEVVSWLHPGAPSPGRGWFIPRALPEPGLGPPWGSHRWLCPGAPAPDGVVSGRLRVPPSPQASPVLALRKGVGARGRETTAPSLQAVLSPPSPHRTGQVHHGERRVGLRGDPVGDSHLLPGAALFPAVRRAGHREYRGVLPGPGQAGEGCWGQDMPLGARGGGDGA